MENNLIKDAMYKIQEVRLLTGKDPIIFVGAKMWDALIDHTLNNYTYLPQFMLETTGNITFCGCKVEIDYINLTRLEVCATWEVY